MPSSPANNIITIAFGFFHVIGGAHSQGQPFTFSSNIAEDFLNDNDGLEASGVDIAPDRSHLVVVSDDGEILFLNLLDHDSGHCMIDMSDEVDGTDFEGAAIDPTVWEPNDMHVYVVHEGGDDDEPLLYKIHYEFDPDDGSCSAEVVETKSLYSAIPCLETSNGIESLGLKRASTASSDAVFVVGIQDTGRVYEITSEGSSNGPYCYNSGMGEDDISASAYNAEHGHIWSYIESEDFIVVVDEEKGCPVAKYDMRYSSDDEEGLAFDFENGIMYLVEDGQGDGSVVSAYRFTYPDDIDECLDTGARQRSCSDFTLCGGAQFPETAGNTKSLRKGGNLFH